MSFSAELDEIINKCDFFFKNNLISKETIVRDYWHFLSYETEKEKHSVLASLHTGSIIFDAVNILFAAFSAIL